MRAGSLARYANAPWTLLLVFLACMVSIFRPYLHGVDPYGYYSWVHAVVVNGTLDTHREFVARICPRNTHSCFYRANPYGIGTSLLWAPFFLLAHLVAPVVGARRDGYSAPYLTLCAIGSSLYAFVGLLLIWRVASHLYSRAVSTVATITLWLGSPLLFYMFLNGFLSHSVDLFVNAIFIYAYVQTRGTPLRKLWLGYGLLIGLAMDVRLPNLFLMAIPATESLARVWKRQRDPGPELGRYLVLVIGGIAALLPQTIVWHVTRHSWFLIDPYAGATADTTDFLHPHLIDVLFSTDRGILVWAPALFIALCGLPIVIRRDRRIGIGLCLFVLANFYLVASWSAWSGAVSFGPRLFLNCVPACIVGLAALIDVALRRISIKVIRAISVLLIIWTTLLMGQYVLRLVPRSGPVPLRQLVDNQIMLVPTRLGRLLHAHIRS